MLVFSAITTHSPLLIPNVGKENLNSLKKTVEAFKYLKEEFVKANPDTVIVITPHGDVYHDAFAINISQDYLARFEEFGDFETEMLYKPDLEFINEFKGKNETKLPLQLFSARKLDHGASIPLYYLLGRNTQRKIVPICTSLLGPEKHLEFGKALKDTIFNQGKRVAVIVSADLSHRLTKASPEGFSPRAKEFDKQVIQLLKKKNSDGLVRLDSVLIEEAKECGFYGILMLLGIIEGMNYDFEVLSYEAPFGIGYLVGEFKI